MNNRREFLKTLGLGALGMSFLPLDSFAKAEESFFNISLAEWSLHRTLRSGKLTNMDFPETARQYGIEGVEYVNQFFKDKAQDFTYLKELKQRANDSGVQNVLIMIDGEGNMADVDKKQRNQAVENHYKWIEAAKFLGCHSIRVNAAGKGTREEMKAAAVDSLGRLSEYGKKEGIGVIVENHGGLSSNGKWLSSVLSEVNMKNCGSLPDFGNFTDYDRYQGVKEMMPYAKGVSAKTYDFDENGNEATIDFKRMFQIVKSSGYHGWIDVEYEGDRLSEDAGIKASKRLLEKMRNEFVG